MSHTITDVAIVGGGLAGLSTAIGLARAGHSVILFEKESYPFHKVCGEYISLEAWPFLESLGVPLQSLGLPIIKKLQISAPNGKTFSTPLPLGGFGISRYLLDGTLSDIAKAAGVTLLEKTRVDEVREGKLFKILFTGEGGAGEVTAKVCCGAYGKRSNLDVKWKRPFITKTDPRQNNYIGVKYHVQTTWPHDVIGLHNFKDGYCGISKIEGDKYCLCYLTTAANLKSCGNNLQQLEGQVLSRNPALRQLFSDIKVAASFPVTIAQISFSKKTQVQNGTLMLGDAAGMITPLCGNGMSIALHTGKIATASIKNFLKDEMDYAALTNAYGQQWRRQFAARLATGRLLQGFFGKEYTSNLFVSTFIRFPFLATSVIKKTHGQPF